MKNLVTDDQGSASLELQALIRLSVTRESRL